MISIESVFKSFDGGKTFAVKEMNLEVNDGETVVLVGSSGCGKTTTMKMINRLIDRSRGTIKLDGKDVSLQPRAAQTIHRLCISRDWPVPSLRCTPKRGASTRAVGVVRQSLPRSSDRSSGIGGTACCRLSPRPLL